jgi:tetratricopeptide (TPR) repeat protein
VSPKEEYSRADVRRKFGLSERQLRSWERQRLIPAAESYSFSDLIAFQTLIKLRENKISSKEILRALESLREKLGWVKQPLSELRVVSDGGRIAVQLSGQKMEAISGQILFDFDASELGGIKSFPERKPKVNRSHESEAWFQKGLELEESGAPVEDAVDAYRKVLDLNPGAAGALVNLGTIYYRLHKFEEAEKYYLAAIDADPEYPLAQFNLGNLYDEQGRFPEAVAFYRRALELNPQYADAHFNLALLCERQGESMKAVHHWKAYLKLDHSGQWAEIARRQLERLRQAVLM